MKIKGYVPKTKWEAIGWLLEENMEVGEKIAKCMRFGIDNTHEGKTNLAALQEELIDLKAAVMAFEKMFGIGGN